MSGRIVLGGVRMSVDYEYLLNSVKKLEETNIDDIDIKGNVSVLDLSDIISYCKVSDACVTERLKARVDKKLFKAGFTPAKFESFDYNPKTNEMKLKLHYYMRDGETYEFKRLKNGDIVLTNTTHPQGAQKLLELIGDCLDDLCKYKEEVIDYLNMNANVKSTNSNFVIGMNKEGMKLTVPGLFIDITYNWANCPEYAISCDSFATTKLLKGNEETILKKVRVNIADCPKWMQDELEYRNKKEIARRERKKNNAISKIFKKR